MEFERSLYLVHERLLMVFSEATPAETARPCDMKRQCRNATVCMFVALGLSLAVLIGVHTAHVGKRGCLGVMLDAAATQWSNGTNTTGGAFFRSTDIFRIQLAQYSSWEGARAALYDWVDAQPPTNTTPQFIPGGPRNRSWAPGPGAAPWPPTPLDRTTWDYVFSPTDPLVLQEVNPGYAPPSRAQGGSRRVDLTLPLQGPCGDRKSVV